jgi:hypothetical protein
MTNTLKCALGVLLTTLISSQALACYSVYDRTGKLVYNAVTAPVDMRYPIHETLPEVFPGGHMVFSITDKDCPEANLKRNQEGDVAGNSPSSWPTAMQSQDDNQR